MSPTKSSGLSSSEAAERLRRYGANRIASERRRPLLALLKGFWAPVPWMLEAAVVLELVLGKLDEALAIAALLIFNVVLSYSQEQHANRALSLLKQRLLVQARVLRDGTWRQAPAEQLVPGDWVHIRMGDFVPADIKLETGALRVDQSMLTGESLAVAAGPGTAVYAGAVVQHGEATGEVTATGAGTYFGRTAELVRVAKTASHLERLIFAIVRWLLAFDATLVAGLVVFAAVLPLPWSDILPFSLMLLVAAVPAALPATFTLATALGARELAANGVLVTHLGAIEEAAAMDVLASDKTGTLTENRLSLVAVEPRMPFDRARLLALAALASDAATQDPLDLAVLSAAGPPSHNRHEFIPFDPARKRSEALFDDGGATLRAIKGAPQTIAALADGEQMEAEVQKLAAQGCRVLAVAEERAGKTALAGLIGFADPLRADSATTLARLRQLGIHPIMVTGDSPATAAAVAQQLGLDPRVCTREALVTGTDAEACEVFAGVFPEDKYHLVQRLQSKGRIVGMTGDGVNDAPALKQAEVGVAVASATDVAKAAASIVLTSPGLGEVVAAVETSRRIYQRMLTYTLNKIIKTFQIGMFLTLGVIFTGELIVTPMLIVLLLFANDFATMSLAADRAGYSRNPDRWNVRHLMMTGGLLTGMILIFLFAVLFTARLGLRLPLGGLQTLIFVVLVATGQGMVYLLRTRGPLWESRPGGWLLLVSGVDLLAVFLLAWRGVLMTPLPALLITGAYLATALYLMLLDFVKRRLVARLMPDRAE